MLKNAVTTPPSECPPHHTFRRRTAASGSSRVSSVYWSATVCAMPWWRSQASCALGT
jgi:hypothetical protein